MTPDQYVAILAALAVLVGAVGKVILDLASYHSVVNSRMDQLLRTTELANQKIGELAGREWGQANPAAIQPAAVQTAQPTDIPPTSN